MIVFSYRIQNFVTPIIESVRTPARITTYPTGRLFWGGAVPGTSCQATIAPSLREVLQQALAKRKPNTKKLTLPHNLCNRRNLRLKISLAPLCGLLSDGQKQCGSSTAPAVSEAEGERFRGASGIVFTQILLIKLFEEVNRCSVNAEKSERPLVRSEIVHGNS
jgi:hypothetical protein